MNRIGDAVCWGFLVLNGLGLLLYAIGGAQPTWWTVLNGAAFTGLLFLLLPDVIEARRARR